MWVTFSSLSFTTTRFWTVSDAGRFVKKSSNLERYVSLKGDYDIGVQFTFFRLTGSERVWVGVRECARDELAKSIVQHPPTQWETADSWDSDGNPGNLGKTKSAVSPLPVTESPKMTVGFPVV
jgi:hypothetical protein